MEVGDNVIYYTHEANNEDHYTRDFYAIVLGIVNDEIIDVGVCPPGGPWAFYRVSLFDPEGENDVVGLSYWREAGSEPPDFSTAFTYVNNPEWVAMVARHKAEREKLDVVPIASLKDRDALYAKQKAEREELAKQLAEEAKPAEERATPQVDRSGEVHPEQNGRRA